MSTETLRPNAAGDATTFTSQNPNSGYHWDKVDEETSDENSTYIYDASEDYDLFNLPAHSVGSGTINFIKIYIRAKKTEVGTTDTFRFKIKTGGTEYDNGSNIQTTTDYTTYNYQWNTNPKTTVAWTWDDIDALQIGVKAVNGYFGLYVTQVYVVVDYTAGVALSAVITGSSTVSGAIAVARALSAVSAGIATVSGAIRVARALSAVSAGVASVTASLTKTKWLSAISAGVASVSGSIRVARALSAVSAGIASVAGSLGILRGLSATIAGSSIVTASLFHVRHGIRTLAAVRNLLAVRNIPPVR